MECLSCKLSKKSSFDFSHFNMIFSDALGLPICVHEALVPAFWAYGCPHLLFEAGGHGFFGLFGEVDARDVSEAGLGHVFDDEFPYACLVGVDGSEGSPRVLYFLRYPMTAP